MSPLYPPALPVHKSFSLSPFFRPHDLSLPSFSFLCSNNTPSPYPCVLLPQDSTYLSVTSMYHPLFIRLLLSFLLLSQLLLGHPISSWPFYPTPLPPLTSRRGRTRPICRRPRCTSCYLSTSSASIFFQQNLCLPRTLRGKDSTYLSVTSMYHPFAVLAAFVSSEEHCRRVLALDKARPTIGTLCYYIINSRLSSR